MRNSQLLKISTTVGSNMTAAIPPEIRQRLMQHEGGYKKVTRDSGGVTRGGVAASSGVPASKIKNMGQADIDKHWDQIWQRSGAHIKDPVAAEYALNMAGNAGDPYFAQTMQRILNKLQPNEPALPGNYNFGPQTQARLAALQDHAALRQPLMDAMEKRHQDLVASGKKKYVANASGWAARDSELRKLMAQPAAPVLVKGKPPAGAVIVPQKPSMVQQPNPPKTPRVLTPPPRISAPSHEFPTLSGPPSIFKASRALTKLADGAPSLARSVVVGTAGSVPGAGAGLLASLGLERLLKIQDPGQAELLRMILASAGGATGSAVLRELDGQFDSERWGAKGEKLDEKHKHPIKRLKRVVEVSAGLPVSKIAAAANFLAIYKQAIVEKVGDKWVLWTKDKSRRLGTHDTAQEAYKQEYAIQKSQEKAASRSIADRLTRLYERRGECHTCKKPNLPENMKCTCADKAATDTCSKCGASGDGAYYDRRDFCPDCAQEKSAAQMVRKERQVIEYDDHCPHCDHKFTEKGYPRPDFSKLPEDEKERSRMIMDGEVDELCPNCKGIVDQRESSDEAIENARKSWGDEAADSMIKRRENQRKRIAARTSKQAVIINHLIPTLKSSIDPGTLADMKAILASRPKPPAAEPMPIRSVQTGELLGHGTFQEFCNGTWSKEASVKSDVQRAMTEAGIPRDAYFFVGPNGKATAFLGDWHDKSVGDAMNKIGRKYFSNYEEPGDSEIGRPDWATSEVFSKATPLQVLERLPHDCKEITYQCCGKVTRCCKDLVWDEKAQEKHTPKEQITRARCKSCETAAQERADGCLPDKEAADQMEPWIGFDLDGTLAKKQKPFNPDSIGDPIAPMIEILKSHLKAGDECRIFTARAAGSSPDKLIHDWLKEQGIPQLKVTNIKDPGMKLLYDDRAVSVESDTGKTKVAGVAELLTAARKATNISPTPAQIEAENYAKGELKVRGLVIKLENPKGSIRRGTDKNGKSWEQKMAWDYGYFKRVDAVDGDKLDVFIGPDPEKGKIWVIDQVLDGKYDESKVMLGFETEEAAREGYLANYEKGWKGLGHIRELSDEKFREWIKGGQTTMGKNAFIAATMGLVNV